MSSSVNIVELDVLEGTLGVSFADKDLLRQALAHSSYLNENPGAFAQSNERFEFLGDAIIGAAVAAELFRRFPDWTEGELTHGRSELVRGEALARVAESVRLGQCLYIGRGEDTAGGRRRLNNLAAAFEALVGALFMDQGYGVARDLVIRLMSEDLAHLEQPTVPVNAKSALQEAVQAKGLSTPEYRIVRAKGKDHAREFTAEVVVGGDVAGRGAGARKSLAEQAAAAEALRAMEL